VTTQPATTRRRHTQLARVWRYLRFRLLIPVVRSPHPPEYTARGVAIGVFWGVTPFLGLQTLLMLVTWQAMKHLLRKDASVVQALVWAWINNPLTMIPMYYAFYLTGLWLMGHTGPFGGYEAFAAVWAESERAPTLLAGIELIARQVGLPLVAGSVPFALVGSWVAYVWALRVVRGRRRHLANRARLASL
jgi:uncharacterized protein (DUF2062 family)